MFSCINTYQLGTQAMLTWTLFGLASSDPGLMKEIQAEIRTVLGDKERPDYDDVVLLLSSVLLI